MEFRDQRRHWQDRLHSADSVDVANARVRGGGVEIEGLEESVKALRKLGPKYQREADVIFTDVAKDILRVAKGVGKPAGYRGPQPKIGRSGNKVMLRSSPSSGVPAFAAEFGEVVADVYGRRIGQTRFKRRTAPRYKPPTSGDARKNKGGYIIQPTVRRRLPHWDKEVEGRVSELINRGMKQAGVRRGR